MEMGLRRRAKGKRMHKLSNPRNFPDVQFGGMAFLDLSTSTGWAYGIPRQTPHCGVWGLSKDWDSGETVDQFYDLLCDFMEWFRPDWLCMEKAIPPNLITSNVGAWNVQIGLAAVTRLVGSHYGRKVYEYPSMTIRSEVLKGLPWKTKGKKGNAKPVEIIKGWANANGVYPADHNAGDALVGLEYAMRVHCRAGFVRDFGNNRL